MLRAGAGRRIRTTGACTHASPPKSSWQPLAGTPSACAVTDRTAATQIDDQIHLLAAGLHTQVVQPDPRQQGDLGTQLSGDEGVENPAEQVTVTQDGCRIDASGAHG